MPAWLQGTDEYRLLIRETERDVSRETGAGKALILNFSVFVCLSVFSILQIKPWFTCQRCLTFHSLIRETVYARSPWVKNFKNVDYKIGV